MRLFWAGLLVGGVCGAALGFAAGWLVPDDARQSPVADSVGGVASAPTTPPGREPDTAATRRKRATPPTAGRPDMGRAGSPTGRSTTRPTSGPAPPPAADGKQAGEPTPYDGWTPEQFLAELRRAAAGHPVESTDQLVKELFEKYPKTHVPMSLALALVAAERSFSYDDVVHRFSESELHAMMRRGVSATWADGRSWALVDASANTLIRRDLVIDESVVNGLLTNEVWRVRSAGLKLAGNNSPASRDRVEAIARGDPSEETRVRALELLIRLAEREEELPSEHVVGLVERALREGNLGVRSQAAGLVPRLGRPGATIALDLLTTQAFSPDSSDAWPLVEAVVRAGMGARLLDYSSTGEVLRVVGGVIHGLGHGEGSEHLAPLQAWFDQIAAALSEGEVEDYYWTLARHGFHETAARAATDPRINGERRRLAFESLFSASTEEGNPIPSFADVAERVAWDNTAPVELRSAALDALDEEEETTRRAFDIRRAILLQHAPPVALRAEIVEQLTSGIHDDALDRRLPEILEILDAVAANDPSSWVRTVATEQREAWAE